jgi:hypothetical protein
MRSCLESIGTKQFSGYRQITAWKSVMSIVITLITTSTFVAAARINR